MKPSLLLTIAGLFVVALALMLSPSVLQAGTAASEPDAPNYQLLANPSMEVYDPPYGQFQGAECQVATDWQRFWYDSPEPCWMDTWVFDQKLGCNCFVEKVHGDTSQLLVSTEPYTAGIQQQVTGLTPGIGYGFHAAMLTIFKTTEKEPDHGAMIKQIGIDPTGGTDPQAPTVIWSEPDGHDEGPWDLEQRVAAFAQVPTMTVFVRVISPYESGHPSLRNLSFLDSAILAQAPYVEASSPALTENPSFVVEWDNVTPAPGGAQLKWVDVQWLDVAEGVWHDWLTETNEVQATFDGQMGHTYSFRARAFQRYPNNAHLYSPYRPEGDTQTRVGGATLAGTVFSPEGRTVAQATVTISGTEHAATTWAGGTYEMDLPPLTGPQTVVLSHPTWAAPAPVYDLDLPPSGTVTLTWTVLPPDDAMINGEFEQEVEGKITFPEGWTSLYTDTLPQVVTEPVHTGRGALALFVDDVVSATQVLSYSTEVSVSVGVAQTMVLTNAWEPVLSYWYSPVMTGAATGPGDVFHVVLTIVTETISVTLPTTPTTPTLLFAAPLTSTPPVTQPITTTIRVTTTQIVTPALNVDGWRHLWHYAGPPESYLTATVTAEFSLWDDGDEARTTVYLDEISLGATPGGPFKTYLPLIAKLH